MYLAKKITFIYHLLSLIPCVVNAAEELSQSFDVTLSVNIIKPVCKLESSSQDIDFGEFDASDLQSSPPQGSAVFNFTGCDNVENIKIRFSGSNIDKDGNHIKNNTGNELAKGVVIKLFDSKNKEFNLNGDNIINVARKDSFDMRVNAIAVATGDSSEIITPGRLDSSVSLEISYE
ncbi:fimbrial protein [Escherichia albertii]|uniref:fimbrial protein n=1 Tax=Escherichia albertii TaxID=208962 RepID=UPI0032B81AC4